MKNSDTGLGTLAQFEACLADAAGERSATDPRRAGVCFFHPFDDGNSRSARLLLDFVLTRAGMCLRPESRLSLCFLRFTTPSRADDRHGARAFVGALADMLVHAEAGPKINSELQAWTETDRAEAASRPADAQPAGP